jgi:hypothetical protein
MARFLPSRYKFCEFYACRGTSLIGAMNLSPVTKLGAGTGAVSRYKLSRSQKSVTVQDLNYVQMCVSGFNSQYRFVLGAGVKAKTVTNNLPLLSVLGLVQILFLAFDTILDEGRWLVREGCNNFNEPANFIVLVDVMDF